MTAPSPDAPRDLLQEVEEALRPFAEGADYFDDGESDDMGVPIALSHLRCSRALLPRLAAVRAAGAVVVPGEPTEEEIARAIFDWLGSDNEFEYRHGLMASPFGEAARTVRALFRRAAPAVGEPEKMEPKSSAEAGQV